MQTYSVKISGILWAGCKGSTELAFNHQPTRAEVIERSGDFQEVTSLKMTRTTTMVERCSFSEILHGAAQFEDCHANVAGVK